MPILDPKKARFYASGYDLSCQTMTLGTWGVKFGETPQAALCDEIKSVVKGFGEFMAGPINGFLSPQAAAAAHELFSTGFSYYNIMAVYGTPDGPNIGDPICAWTAEQAEYSSIPGEGFFGFNLTFPAASPQGSLAYAMNWGVLVHAKIARTAANTAVATIDNGAATSKGGLFVYHLFSSDGTVTLSLDDSATNANNAAFAALTGATSGEIDASVTPKSGIVALGQTATIRRYPRWQMSLGTATTATFALALIRG